MLKIYRGSDTVEKEIMTIKEFAQALDLKEYVVRRMLKEGKLVYFKSGKHAYIHYGKSIQKMWK